MTKSGRPFEGWGERDVRLFGRSHGPRALDALLGVTLWGAMAVQLVPEANAQDFPRPSSAERSNIEAEVYVRRSLEAVLTAAIRGGQNPNLLCVMVRDPPPAMMSNSYETGVAKCSALRVRFAGDDRVRIMSPQEAQLMLTAREIARRDTVPVPDDMRATGPRFGG